MELTAYDKVNCCFMKITSTPGRRTAGRQRLQSRTTDLQDDPSDHLRNEMNAPFGEFVAVLKHVDTDHTPVEDCVSGTSFIKPRRQARFLQSCPGTATVYTSQLAAELFRVCEPRHVSAHSACKKDNCDCLLVSLMF